MKKNVLAVVAVIALAAPAVSMAQLGGLLGGVKSSSNSGADLSGSQDSLVRNYMGAGKDVLTANGHLADALGIKAQAVNAAATADSLSAKDVEAQDKAISADAAAVAEALKGGAALKDGEAKAKYAKGLLSLASGVKKYLGLRNDAQGFAKGMSSASPLQMAKLQSGAYVVKNLPTSITNLTSVLKSAVEFGKSNGVEIPADATSVL
ncbi:MAG: hypothetical protein GXC94_04190 [Comamonadaceae bacterium]|jgi:hypothetical protein|nr:hypothetical protein [Comamonadaceae bacterium]